MPVNLIAIVSAVLIVLEQTGNAAIGAQVVVHQHSDVAMDGTLLPDSAPIGVPAHSAYHLLLLAVADAVGIVVSTEVVG